jgi:Ethanolamine utilization protein EutJ (predicted chaperonin)
VALVGGRLLRVAGGGGLRERRDRHVDEADVMKPGHLATDLALLAGAAELDRCDEGVGGARIGVLAGARGVALEGLEQRRAALADQLREFAVRRG